MSNDKVPATFHPEIPPSRKVYRVLSRVAGDEVWYECPICGPLAGAVLKGHGPEHIVPDASQ